MRTVVLNRPEKRNALNSEMLELLYAAFSGEPEVEERVAVIRAEGPVFCAGLDLREREGGLPPGEVSIEQMLDAIQHWPLPVVAVVHGDAIAGGNELALHCDFRGRGDDCEVWDVAGADWAGAELVSGEEAAGGGGSGGEPGDFAAGRAGAGVADA